MTHSSSESTAAFEMTSQGVVSDIKRHESLVRREILAAAQAIQKHSASNGTGAVDGYTSCNKTGVENDLCTADDNTEITCHCWANINGEVDYTHVQAPCCKKEYYGSANDHKCQWTCK